MAKLYKAVDERDGTLSCFLVNERGVAISEWTKTDDIEIVSNKKFEDVFHYDHISQFEKHAIDPVLIAEW